MKTQNQLLLFIFLLASSFSVGGTLGMSIKFNNNTDEDLVIQTTQYGGTPTLHEQSDLTKEIQIKKQTSGHIFLFETAPWLVWKATSIDGKIIQKGSFSLQHATLMREIDINPINEQQPDNKSDTPK